MLASPEAAKFVLVTHSHLFKPTYPKSKEKLIGPSALFFHQGEYHARLRKLIQSSLSSPNSLQRWVADVEALAVSAMESWTRGEDHVTNTFYEMKKVILWSINRFYKSTTLLLATTTHVIKTSFWLIYLIKINLDYGFLVVFSTLLYSGTPVFVWMYLLFLFNMWIWLFAVFFWCRHSCYLWSVGCQS